MQKLAVCKLYTILSIHKSTRDRNSVRQVVVVKDTAFFCFVFLLILNNNKILIIWDFLP